MFDDFSFENFEAEDSGLDNAIQRNEDTDLDRLVDDSRNRARARAEGREINPDGTRASGRRVQASNDDSGPARRKISTMGDLAPFVRIGTSDMLVHEAERDIWEMKEDEEGGVCIERVLDEDGSPLKI